VHSPIDGCVWLALHHRDMHWVEAPADEQGSPTGVHTFWAVAPIWVREQAVPAGQARAVVQGEVQTDCETPAG